MISKRNVVTALDYSCCPSDNYNERSPPYKTKSSFTNKVRIKKYCLAKDYFKYLTKNK